MPGTIRGAVSNGTFPVTLSTKFARSQSVQARVNEYHDGTTQRQALVDETRRTWQLAKRLTAADLTTLRDFWQANPNTAFTFYDPFETVPPFTQNPTTTDGAYLVRFNSDWNETIGMVRSDAGVELIEMTASPAGRIISVIYAASQPGIGSVLYLGSGSAPAGWENTGFDDSSWGSPVLQTEPVFGAAITGSQWITNSAASLFPGDQALYRIPFTITGTPLDATIQIGVDDYITSIYINGTALSVPPPSSFVWPPVIFGVSATLLSTGDNLLAISVQNDSTPHDSGNYLSLDFVLAS